METANVGLKQADIPRTNRRIVTYWSCWAAIAFLAVLLRLPTIRSGLPYIDYIDEGYVLHQAIDLLNHRTWDTRWYGYPSLPAYLTVAALTGYSPIYRLKHGHGFRQDLPRDQDVHTADGDNYDLISPPELIIAGRVVVVCLSVGTVILTNVIAVSLGGKRMGLIAMAITAVCPTLVTRAPNVIVDSFGAFFVLLSLYSCSRLRALCDMNRRALGWTCGSAGAAAGLAFASKYTLALVMAAVVVNIIMLPVHRSYRTWLLMLAGGGFFIGAVLAAPATLIKPGAVMHEVMITARNYTMITSRPGYLGQAVRSSELGWPLVILGCVGSGWMLRSSRTRASLLSWITFASLVFVIFAGKSFQPFRNLLSLVPEFCIAAAFALALLLDRGGRKMTYQLRHFAGFFLIALLITSLGYTSFQYLKKRTAERDTRNQAVDWLRHHTTKSDQVLAMAELAILPSEWQRVEAAVRVAPWSNAPQLLKHDKFNYVVTGDFGRSQSLPRLPVGLRASFGHVPTPRVPYFWRTNDERILIFAREDN